MAVMGSNTQCSKTLCSVLTCEALHVPKRVQTNKTILAKKDEISQKKNNFTDALRTHTGHVYIKQKLFNQSQVKNHTKTSYLTTYSVIYA